MKNSKAILVAIFASLFAVLTVVNMSMASPKSAGENTLDMLEIMTRAFDEDEAEPGGEDCSPNPCTTPVEQWDSNVRLKGRAEKEHVVEIEGGARFKSGDEPPGAEITAHYRDCIIGYTWYCGFSLFNQCCPSAQHNCHYGYNNCGGGTPE